MSPITRRRSNRLRGGSATPAHASSGTPHRLDSVAERDETPNDGPRSILDQVVSSPMVPRTPATAGRIKPTAEEMHPSKAHQSTTQKPDSGLRLGFTDINVKGSNLPSGVGQQTPSKTGISDSFDFRFARPGPQLGAEAQRMMDELREEAARIKAKLQAEQAEEKRKKAANEAAGVSSRKIAHAKGRVGRFSDVHMAEFKRMDSIAGHPSSFRALPSVPATKSLKRTQSKAKLDETDEGSAKDVAARPGHSERLENVAPAKRARQNVTDDISTARPASSDGSNLARPPPHTPTTSRSQSSFIPSVMTPTQASLARATSVKKSATQIPTLSKSPSKPNLIGTPRGLKKSSTIGSITKSASKSMLRSPGKFDRVKSILRHPSFTSKNASAASPSIPKSPAKPDVEKALPSVPTTPLRHSKSMRQVNFTPRTVDKQGPSVQNSPTPIKSGIPRSASKSNLKVSHAAVSRPTSSHSAKEMEVEYPSIAGLPEPSHSVVYPSLEHVAPLPEASESYTPRARKIHRPPQSVPGTFTFRSDKTINFGVSPKGFGSSPGQASIRQVRDSILETTMPGSFPGSDKENSAPIPSVAHGVANKKRRRVDSDDEEEDAERHAKKHKPQAAEGQMLMAPRITAEKLPSPVKAPSSPSKIPSPEKKKGLSLSRLNMLSRPKMRK
ncbi:hypothetical protein PVAG01_00277 [Phlyctema vagabunda]|uniref:Erythromycin esterase n=1 Tax=Phlyctema vagabunda TaxID=108571 RepID=A0ABR4PTT0_9HELO